MSRIFQIASGSCIAALLTAAPAFAATWTWNGGGGNDHWTNGGVGGNWTNASSPANDGTADIVFGDATRLTPDMNANWNIHSLTFDNTGYIFTLGSSTGSTLTIGAGGINISGFDVYIDDVVNEEITHAITLSAAQTWSATQGTHYFFGPVNNGGKLLTINTASTTAGFVISGVLSGSGGLTKNGPGTLELKMATGVANTYSGTTTVNAGTLLLDGSIGLIIPGSLNIGDGVGTAIDTLLSNGNDRIADSATVNVFSTGAWDLYSYNSFETITNLNIVSTGVVGGGLVRTGNGTLAILGNLTMTGGTVNTASTGTLLLNGGLTTNASAITASISSKLNLGGAARTFTIADGAAANDLDITGVVDNAAIVKNGPGTLRLGVANTYNGSTTLNAGTILIGNDAALGTGLLIGNGGTLQADGAARTIANAVNLTALSTVTGSLDVTLNGPISGAGGLIKSGVGTLTLSGANTFTGGVTIVAGTLTQSGGTLPGVVTNQASFVYNGGTFSGQLVNQGSATFNANFTAGNGMVNYTSISAGTGFTFTLNGSGLDNEGTFTLAGGTLAVANMTNSGSFVFDSGTLTATAAGGTISASIVSNTPNTTINISADNVSLGNAASFTGFNHQGVLNVGANAVTLNSAGYAKLGVLTTLNGGTINAPNGVTFGSGSNLLGHGAVSARVAAELGSVIQADGALALGDAASPAGYFSNGELRTKQFAVTLNSSGPSTLGNLTTLGSGASPGTLSASNGFVVDFGKTVTGFGTIDSTDTLAQHATINGTVQGNSAEQPITLSGYIKGVGTFNNVTFTGIYSPGLSPTIATVGSITLAPTSTLLMEVGGTTAGGSYDQIQATGTVSLGGTLAVSLINGFNPAAGNSFDILDWGSLSGTFSALQLPALTGGFAWNTSQLYSTGVLSVVSSGLPGDFNHNGVVDAADYVVWRKGLGITYTQDDYNVWRANFGQTAGSGSGSGATAGLSSSAVPEPGTLVSLLVAIVGLFVFPRARAASKNRG